LRRLHHLARVQQLQVQRGGQQRVIKPGLARPQRVFVAAEQRQSVRDEIVQGLQRVVAGDGPAEAVQAAWMIGKAGIDQVQHLARDRVGCEALRRG
jgi:hypothetical protein